jgi:hypothetical protein
MIAMPRLIFLVTLYLALDVANPMMPGALAFIAEESVEVRLADRLGSHGVASAFARTTERLKPVGEVLTRPQPVVRAAFLSRTHPPRRLPARPSAASPEDD